MSNNSEVDRLWTEISRSIQRLPLDDAIVICEELASRAADQVVAMREQAGDE